MLCSFYLKNLKARLLLIRAYVFLRNGFATLLFFRAAVALNKRNGKPTRRDQAKVGHPSMAERAKAELVKPKHDVLGCLAKLEQQLKQGGKVSVAPIRWPFVLWTGRCF